MLVNAGVKPSQITKVNKTIQGSQQWQNVKKCRSPNVANLKDQK